MNVAEAVVAPGTGRTMAELAAPPARVPVNPVSEAATVAEDVARSVGSALTSLAAIQPGVQERAFGDLRRLVGAGAPAAEYETVNVEGPNGKVISVRRRKAVIRGPETGGERMRATAESLEANAPVPETKAGKIAAETGRAGAGFLKAAPVIALASVLSKTPAAAFAPELAGFLLGSLEAYGSGAGAREVGKTGLGGATQMALYRAGRWTGGKATGGLIAQLANRMPAATAKAAPLIEAAGGALGAGVTTTAGAVAEGMDFGQSIKEVGVPMVVASFLADMAGLPNPVKRGAKVLQRIGLSAKEARDASATVIGLAQAGDAEGAAMTLQDILESAARRRRGEVRPPEGPPLPAEAPPRPPTAPPQAPQQPPTPPQEVVNASAIRTHQGQRVPEAAQEGPQAQGGAQEGQGDRGAHLEQAPPRGPEPVVEGGKGPVQEVAKQPWEMSRDEWNAATRFYRSGKTKNAQLPTGQRVILTNESTAGNFLKQSGPFLETLRRQTVEAALRQGKPVPSEVLTELGLAPAVEKVGTSAEVPIVSPVKTTAATEQPPEHVVRALQKPWRVVSDSVITKTKEQAKETLREAIANGTVTRDTPVRLTDTRELHNLATSGELAEEKSAQIVVGENGEVLPIMGYGHGISAAIILPEGYSRKAAGLEHAQPNEVKIDPKAPAGEMQFIVAGYKRLLTYAELAELIETGKLAALEQAAALHGEKPEIILKGGEILPGEPAAVPGPEVGTPKAAGREPGGLHPTAGEVGIQGGGPAVGAEGTITPGAAPAPPPVPQAVAEVAPAVQSYTIEPASYAKNAIIVRIQGGAEGFKGPLHDAIETLKGRYVKRERGYILPKSKEAKVRAALDAALTPPPPAAAAITPAEVPVKQPWEMTREEWLREVNAAKINFTGTGGEGEYGMGRVTKEGNFNTGVDRLRFLRDNLPDHHDVEGLQYPADHQEVVAKALSEGKPVPPEVLTEYPDLKNVNKNVTKPEIANILPPAVSPIVEKTGEQIPPPKVPAVESEAVTAAIASYQRKTPTDVSGVRARRDKLEIRQEEINRPLETLKKDYEARRRGSKTREAAQKRYTTAVTAADEEMRGIGMELGSLRKQSYDASLENALLADPQRELNVDDAELSRLGAAMRLLPKGAADAARRLATERLRVVAEKESAGKSTPEEIEQATEDGVRSLESLPLMSADQHRGAIINSLVGDRRERIKEATKDDPDLEAEGHGYGGRKWQQDLKAAGSMKDLDGTELEIADARPRGAAILVKQEADRKATDLAEQKRVENLRRPLPEGVREFSYKLTKAEHQALDEADLGGEHAAVVLYGTRGHAQHEKAVARLRSRGLIAPDSPFLTPRGEDVARAIQQERMGLPYDQRPGINWVPPDPAAMTKGWEGVAGKAVGGLFADKNGDPWITDGYFLVRAKPGTKVPEGPAPEIGPIVNVTKADLDPVSGSVAWYRTRVRDNVILSNGLIVNADLLAAVLGKEGGDLYHRKTDTGQPLETSTGLYVLRGDQVHGVIMPIRVDGTQDLPENYRWMWEDGKIHERDLTKAPAGEVPALEPTEDGGVQESLPFEGVGTEPLLRKATLPTERIPVAPLPGGTEGETGQLIPTLAKSLARRIRVAKMKRGRLGQYEPSSTATSIRYQGDLATTSHEIGHDLDDAYGITPLFSSGQYDAELKPFWNLGTKIPASKPNAIVLRRQEGWAEFLRAMIGNPDETRTQAPKLAKVYDERLPTQVRTILGNYSDGVRRFAGLSPEEMVRSNVEMEAATRTQRLRQDLAGTGYEFNTMGWADKLGSKIIDDLGRVTKGIETAKELRGIDRLLPQNDPAILIRNWFGWTEERFVDILANGVPIYDKYRERATGPFADIFESLDNSHADKLQADYRDTVALLLAERVGEKAGFIDAETQAKIDQWDEAVADGRMKVERRDAAVARLKKITEARKGRLAGWGHGVYSDTEIAASAIENLKRDPERFARLQKTADAYRKWANATLRYNVDSGRMSEESFAQIKARNQQYAAMHRVASEIDPNYQTGGRAGGRKLGTPTETVQKFTGSTKKLGNPIVNLMMQTAAILREAERNAGVRAFTDILTSPRKMGEGTPIPLEQIGRRVKEGTKDAITVWVNGKPQAWQFEEGLHAELQALGKLPMTPAVLRVPASILRWSVVHSPPFQIRNAIRDALERFRVSDVNSLPWDTLKGYTKEQLSDYLRAGGATGWYFHDRTRYALKLKETLDDLAKDETTILASFHSLRRGAERFYRGSELIGRMAEYRRAFVYGKEKLGYDDYNASLFAANKARGLMDFNTAGSWIRWVNQIIPFTNPSVRGVVRNLQAMQQHPGRFLAAWAASILIPKLIEYLWNSTGDDAEEYRQLPDYQRDLFFNFKIAPNLWLRIPLGFEVAVWGGSVTRAIDYARGNKNAFDGHIGQLMRATLPLDETALAGPFRGIVQMALNYDLFRNQHIIPAWEEGKDVRLRDTSRGSRLGQAVQQVLGVDARKVDFLLVESLGDLGRYIQEASNVGRAEKRPHTTADILRQVGAVFATSPAGQAKDVQAIFDTAQRAGMEQDKQVAHLRGLLKQAYESPTDKERDALLKRVREYATRIRPLIERRAEQAIQTKGQKMQRKMYGAEATD
jgi:hypothetical protein